MSSALQIQGRLPLFLLCAATLGLLTLSFPPAAAWPLAYICLVPWAVAVCTTLRARRVYFASWLLGTAFFAVNCHWLYDVTGLGYFALCGWFGLYFPLAAWPVRHMFRRHSAPLSIVLPISWVTWEFVRGQTLAGFPWFFLAHSHYRVPTMIQSADLVGSYGLSFLIAMVNGWLADLLVQPLRVTRRHRFGGATSLPIGSAVTIVSLIAAVIYGRIRLSEFTQTQSRGPKVSIIQQDFPSSITGGQVSAWEQLEAHFVLARQAAFPADPNRKPDLIVFPEAVWPGAINREFLDAAAQDLDAIRRHTRPGESPSRFEQFRENCRIVHDALRDLAAETGAAIVFGAHAYEWRRDELPRLEKFNSAFVFLPNEPSYTGRYDKVHLVLFGEFVPFRYSTWDPVYRWLNSLTPFGQMDIEYSLDFGREHRVFKFAAPSQDGRMFRFALPICYEDTVPNVIRRFVTGPDRGKQVDFLLNMSNDGWFNHSSELEQHLATCVFRAVEYRVPIARSVNTGISIFVKPTGDIHSRVRLSQKEMHRFDAIERELRALLEVADRIVGRVQQEGGRGRPDGDDLQTAQTVLVDRIPPAIDQLTTARPATRPSTQPSEPKIGERHLNEFDFVGAWLEQLFGMAVTATGSERLERWSRFTAQVQADLDTVRRWRKKDYTAPGFRTEELVGDERHSPYAEWGDWFPLVCAATTGMILINWIIHKLRQPSRRRRRREQKRAAAA